MKTLLFTLCLLLTTVAFGQSAGSISNQPQVREVPSHTLHAAPQPMAREASLLVASRNVSAQGEKPLWEAVGSTEPARVPDAMPLGDVARLLRRQHATAQKATVVFEK
jgi:hypothetical protein